MIYDAKYATVFGGGFRDTTTIEYQESILIGKLLSDNGYVVKNGGYYGIMEAVSKGASENGGIVIGFTCRSFSSTKGNPYLSLNIKSDDTYDRLRELITGSEIFIVQKGGLGTLSEVITLLDEARKVEHPPKIYVMGSIWKEVFTTLKLIMNEKEQALVEFCENYEELKNNFLSNEF
jgi:uncharacterized protein (TIGR00725 family)